MHVAYRVRGRQAAGTHAGMGWAEVPPNLRAVMVDTKGPEIRTGTLAGHAAVLEIGEGDEVVGVSRRCIF